MFETSTCELLEVIVGVRLASVNTDKFAIVRVLYQQFELKFNLGNNMYSTVCYQSIRQINLASTASNFVVYATE